MNALEEIVRPHLDMDMEMPYNVPVNKPFLLNGDYSASVLRWYTDDIPDIGGPFTRIEWIQLQLTKRQRLNKQLLRKGWKPTWYTDAGNPKLVQDGEPCPNLTLINGFPGEELRQYLVYAHRKSQLEGLLKRVRGDGRIPAGAVVIGTNTRRMTHRVLVNIPKAADYVLFGKEMRSIFTVPPGYRMVGADASGLELRMLCHYMGDDEYTDVLLNSDIHTYNQELAGLPNRDAAKTFIYALIYGAGDAKLGKIVGGTANDGAEMRRKFLSGLPKLDRLIENVKFTAERRGFLRAVDGGPLRMRYDNGKMLVHKALNTLCQGSGSIVMKKAALIAYDDTRGLDAEQIINMHDEYQYEVVEENAQRVADILEESIRKSGRYFNLNIPLDAEGKIGINWSETH